MLEPAVYGIPVLFGPKYHNSQEAELLVKLGGSFVVNDKKEAFTKIRRLFSDITFKSISGNICSEFVIKNTGATDRISEEICRFI